MEQIRLNSIKRIHIIGAAGSGKTTLARWCAERLDCTWLELDTVAYENGYGNGRKRTLEERLGSLKEVKAQPIWITEGFFIWWIDELLEAADLIVWLDLPWYVAMSRIVTHHVKLSWTGENRYPGLWNLTKFFFSWCPYYLQREPHIPLSIDDDVGVNRESVIQYLQPHMKKVIKCRKPSDVEEFLAQLG